MDPFRFSIFSKVNNERVLSLLSGPAPKRVVDFGCGMGGFFEALDDHFRGEARLIGVEIDKRQREFVKNSYPYVEVFETLNLIPDRSIDVVLMIEVIEHLQCEAPVLAEFRRILRRDGMLIVSTPNLAGWRTRSALKRAGHTDPGSADYHFRDGYTRSSLSSVLGSEWFFEHAYQESIGPVTELILELCKMPYVLLQKKHRVSGRAVMQKVESASFLFQIYKKLIFPFGVAIGRFENRWIGPGYRGHHIVAAYSSVQ